MSVAPAELPRRLDAPRTAIRALRRDDGRTLLDLRRRNRDFLAPWDPERPPSFFTAAGQEELLGAELSAWREGRGYGFLVLDAGADDRPLGRVTLSQVVRGPLQSAALGYWIDQASNGRGHATAAVRLAVRFAFEHAGLHRVAPAVMPRNARSTRVLEKVGFRREGRALRYLRIAGCWEDHDLWALTVEEYAPDS